METRETLRREWAAMTPAEREKALDRALECQHARWVRAGFVGYGPHRRQLYVCTACGKRTTTVPATSGATGTGTGEWADLPPSEKRRRLFDRQREALRALATAPGTVPVGGTEPSAPETGQEGGSK